MQFENHGNGHGMNDLYVLPECTREFDALVQVIRELRDKVGFFLAAWERSDIAGQDWYGKTFLEIPFGQGFKDAIETRVAEIVSECDCPLCKLQESQR